MGPTQSNSLILLRLSVLVVYGYFSWQRAVEEQICYGDFGIIGLEYSLQYSKARKALRQASLGSDALGDVPLAVALLHRIVVAADGGDMDVDVCLYDGHPGGSVTRCL